MSLDLFTADVELSEGAYLETIVTHKEQGHIVMDLLDDTGACLPLSGATANLPRLTVHPVHLHELQSGLPAFCCGSTDWRQSG